MWLVIYVEIEERLGYGRHDDRTQVDVHGPNVLVCQSEEHAIRESKEIKEDNYFETIGSGFYKRYFVTNIQKI